jgi:hypothetical protein
MTDSPQSARPALRYAPLLLLATVLLTGSALGQTPSASNALPPPKLEPQPKLEPPPKLEPLPEVAGDPELEPQVTITRKEGETVEEARVQGRVVWIKVTPRHGRPYFLIPDGSGQMFIRRDNFDSGLKVPLWLLFSF